MRSVECTIQHLITNGTETSLPPTHHPPITKSTAAQVRQLNSKRLIFFYPPTHPPTFSCHRLRPQDQEGPVQGLRLHLLPGGTSHPPTHPPTNPYSLSLSPTIHPPTLSISTHPPTHPPKQRATKISHQNVARLANTAGDKSTLSISTHPPKPTFLPTACYEDQSTHPPKPTQTASHQNLPPKRCSFGQHRRRRQPGHDLLQNRRRRVPARKGR